MVTAELKCVYVGSLIKGGEGLATFRSGSFKKKMIKQFYEMGLEYSKAEHFDKKIVSDFAGPEYFSRRTLCLIKLVTPLNRLVWIVMGKKLGEKWAIDAKPYENKLNQLKENESCGILNKKLRL